MGVLLTTVANVFAVMQTAPVFCALGDWLGGEKPPFRTQVMIVAGLVGVGVIFAGSISMEEEGETISTTDSGTSMLRSVLGVCVALGNPISWAFYWAVLRRRSRGLQGNGGSAANAKDASAKAMENEDGEGDAGDPDPTEQVVAASAPIVEVGNADR